MSGNQGPRTRSSFNGKVEEISGIYVDNFENPATDGACAYFLSHFHTDHTVGLDRMNLLRKLKDKKNVFIYATELCAHIVKHNNPHLKPYVKILKLGSNLIPLPGDNQSETFLSVTLIPAGHCMGSTMFLFETIAKKVLYTGDFRIRENDIPKYAALHHDGEIIKLDTLYVDTTFNDKDYMDFPKRSDTALDAVSLISQLLEDENVCVVLETPAHYTYEHVFNTIYQKLNMKVYVNDKWDFYSTIQHLVPGVTNNSEETRVFLNCARNGFRTKRIRFSAMTWSSWSDDDPAVRNKHDKYFICFATHCSRSELISFVNYLNPDKVVGFPNPYVVKSSNSTYEGCYEGMSSNKAPVKRLDSAPRSYVVEDCNSTYVGRYEGMSSKKTPVKRRYGAVRSPKDRKVDPAVLKKMFG
ncbi:protein artemis-like [Epargyreus clarus]|uniref:protein artemis-like n=1 Tax=Epargyreus clarus TaxID=520877 RepID=UPI003C2E9843